MAEVDKNPPAESIDPLVELRDRVADMATVIAALPAPTDVAARLAHTRLSLFADAHAEAQRQERELREQAERERRFSTTNRQLKDEGRLASAAR